MMHLIQPTTVIVWACAVNKFLTLNSMELQRRSGPRSFGALSVIEANDPDNAKEEDSDLSLHAFLPQNGCG